MMMLRMTPIGPTGGQHLSALCQMFDDACVTMSLLSTAAHVVMAVKTLKAHQAQDPQAYQKMQQHTW